jgi:hypothetical protein
MGGTRSLVLSSEGKQCMTPIPIRLRLTFWYSAILSCSGIALCAATWYLLQQSIQRVEIEASGIARLPGTAQAAILTHATSIALLHLFARDLLWITPLLLALAAVLGYWMSRKAMNPIAEFARLARQINSNSPNLRLPLHAPRMKSPIYRRR